MNKDLFKNGKKYLIDARKSGTTDLDTNYGCVVSVDGDGKLQRDPSDNEKIFYGEDVLLNIDNSSINYQSTDTAENGDRRPYKNIQFTKTYTLNRYNGGNVNTSNLVSISNFRESVNNISDRLFGYKMNRKGDRGRTFHYFVPYNFSVAPLDGISESEINTTGKSLEISISDARGENTGKRDYQFWSGRKSPQRTHNRVYVNSKNGVDGNGVQMDDLVPDFENSAWSEILEGGTYYLPRIWILKKEDTPSHYKVEFQWGNYSKGITYSTFDAGYEIETNSKHKSDWIFNGDDLEKGQVPFDMSCSEFETAEKSFFEGYNFDQNYLTNSTYIYLDGVKQFWYNTSGNEVDIEGVDGQISSGYECISLSSSDLDLSEEDLNTIFNGSNSTDFVDNFIQLYNKGEGGDDIDTSTEPENGDFLFVNQGSRLYQYKRKSESPGYNKGNWELITDGVLEFNKLPAADGNVTDGSYVAISSGSDFKVAQYFDGNFTYLDKDKDNAADLFTRITGTTGPSVNNSEITNIFTEETANIVDQTEIFLINDGRGKYTLDLDNQTIYLSENNGQISNRELLKCTATLYLGDVPVKSGVKYRILKSYTDETHSQLDDSYYNPEDNLITIDTSGKLNFNEDWQFNGKKTVYVRIGATLSTKTEYTDEDFIYSTRLMLALNTITNQTLKGQIEGFTNFSDWYNDGDFTTRAREWISGHQDDLDSGTLWILNLEDDNDPNDGLMYLWDGTSFAEVGKLKGLDGESGVSINFIGDVNDFGSLPDPSEDRNLHLYKVKDTGKFWICKQVEGVWSWVEMFSEISDYWITMNCSSISRETTDSEGNPTINYNPGYLTIKAYKQLGSVRTNISSEVYDSGKLKVYACDQTDTNNTNAVVLNLSKSNDANELYVYLNNPEIVERFSDKEMIRVEYTNPFGNTEREEIPINNIIQGSVGPQGPIGAVIRGPRMWESGVSYNDGTIEESTSNEDVKIKFIDIVVRGGSYYKCISPHTSGSEFDGEKWILADGNYEFIATGLLLADTAKIGATTTGSVTITGDDNVVHAGIQGPRAQKDEDTGQDIVDDDGNKMIDESSVVIWAGRDSKDGDNLAEAPFSVTYDGHLYAKNADVEGTIRAKSGTIGEPDGTKINITSSGLSTTRFYIKTDGTIYANQMVLGGTIPLTSYESPAPKLYSAAPIELEEGDTAVGGSSNRLFGADNTTQVRVTDTGIEISDLNAASGTAEAGIRGTTSGDDVVFYAGKRVSDGQTNYKFAVTKSGQITATGAKITGEITATSITLSGCTIGMSDVDGLDAALNSVDKKINENTSSIQTQFTNALKDYVSNADLSNQGFITGSEVMDYVYGLSDYATKEELQQELNNLEIPVIGAPSTSTVNGVTTTTINIDGTNYDWTAAAAGEDYMVFGSGAGTRPSGIASPSSGSGYFVVSTDGLLTANNAVVYGKIYASEGEFTGNVYADSIEYRGYVKSRFNNITNLHKDVYFSSGDYLSSLLANKSNYLGAKSSAPSGSSGKYYYNTTNSNWYYYYSGEWKSQEKNRKEAYFGSELDCYVADERSYLILTKANLSNGAKVLILPNPTDELSGFTYHIIVPPKATEYNESRTSIANWGLIIRCVSITTDKFVNYALAGSVSEAASQIVVCGGHLELVCIGSGGWAITQSTGELDMLDNQGSLIGAYSPIYGYSNTNATDSPEIITKIWAGSGASVISEKRSDTIYIDTSTNTQ